MKVAIIGSRSLNIEISLNFTPTEIVTGGAKGIDSCAANYAKQRGIKLKEFLPDYSANPKAAPHIRNRKIVDYADIIIAHWDGVSKGTKSVIDYANKVGKPPIVYINGKITR